MKRLALLLATALGAHAAPVTLNFGSQAAGGAVGGSGGSELPPGALVLLGAFSLAPAEVEAASGDHFTLREDFEVIAATEVGTFGGTAQGASGAFSGSVTVDSKTYGGRRIYLWILDAGDFGAATAHLVLSAPDWTVPAFGSESFQTGAVDPGAGDTVFIATREAGVTSPTLGGPLNQAVPLDHPDHSDRDRDGRPALVEFATGSDPDEPDALPLEIRPGTLRLTRRVGSAGSPTDFATEFIDYELQRSTDLVGWDTFDADVQSVSTAPHPTDPDLEILTLIFPAGENPSSFWRVRVTRR